MSKRPQPAPEPHSTGSGQAYEARAHFRHDGEDRRPGDIVELSAEQAAELEALGFVVRAYQRRDLQSRR